MPSSVGSGVLHQHKAVWSCRKSRTALSSCDALRTHAHTTRAGLGSRDEPQVRAATRGITRRPLQSRIAFDIALFATLLVSCAASMSSREPDIALVNENCYMVRLLRFRAATAPCDVSVTAVILGWQVVVASLCAAAPFHPRSVVRRPTFQPADLSLPPQSAGVSPPTDAHPPHIHRAPAAHPSQGLQCVHNSEAPSGCPHGAAECGKGSSCVLWERGWFAPPTQCTPTQYSPTPEPRAACPAALALPGRFDQAASADGSTIWVVAAAAAPPAAPPPPCALRYYTPAEAFNEVLYRRRLAFAGDSIVRGLFLRLVAFLRGFDAVGDRHFHTDALYSRNGSADLLSVEQLPDSPLDPRPVSDASLVVSFTWAGGTDHLQPGSPSELIIPADAVLKLAPDAAVLGVVYWQTNPRISRRQKAAATRVARGGARVFWVGTPPFPESYQGALELRFNAGVPAKNADMRQFCAENAPNMTFLPMDAVAEAAAGDFALRPSLHFMVRPLRASAVRCAVRCCGGCASADRGAALSPLRATAVRRLDYG